MLHAQYILGLSIRPVTSDAFPLLEKLLFYYIFHMITSACIEAWMCNFSPFKEILTEQPTDQTTNQASNQSNNGWT